VNLFLPQSNTESKFEFHREMNENNITERIIQCAIKVHTALGPGLLESAYKECLFYELFQSGLNVEKEKPLPLIYKEVKLECGYRIDLFVDNKIVIEVKSVEALHDIHLAQTLTYLKLLNIRIGLLINFNVMRLKDGLKRVVNGY
jgi:GxxExxY protein